MWNYIIAYNNRSESYASITSCKRVHYYTSNNIFIFLVADPTNVVLLHKKNALRNMKIVYLLLFLTQRNLEVCLHKKNHKNRSNSFKLNVVFYKHFDKRQEIFIAC